MTEVERPPTGANPRVLLKRATYRQRQLGACVLVAAAVFAVTRALRSRAAGWGPDGWLLMVRAGSPPAADTPWSVVSTQPRGPWCDALMRDPKPADAECSPDTPAGCPPGVAPRFFSQFGQDEWLWTHHFRHLRRRGVFVDLAANHPIHISNTYFFESCLRWSGLCIEPNAQYHPGIIEHRSCELLPLCVANHSASVEFIEAGGLGGIADSNKNGERLHTAPRRRITCAPLSRLLRRRGLTHVDFLSLDIEGGELMALHSIDWDAVQIDVIALEDETRDAPATKFLTAMGYKAVAVQSARRSRDQMFFHPSVEMGHPTE